MTVHETKGAALAAKVGSVPAPAWARAASDADVYWEPTRTEIARALRDPEGGGAVALLGDPNKGWLAWRRGAAPMHGEMLDYAENLELLRYDPKNPLVRTVAGNLEEAEAIMGGFGPLRR